MTMKTYHYPENQQPMRLDRIVATLLSIGLRASRAHIEQGQVLVDGHPGAKGTLVRPGQVVRVPAIPMNQSTRLRTKIVRQNAHYAAIFKPKEMHSVAGKDQDCVQYQLPLLGLDGWQLVNRLDYLTSGLILAAQNKVDIISYKTLQNQGAVHKYYLALVQGNLSSALTLQHRICDQKRKKVRVIHELDEKVRSTFVEPLQTLDNKTLVVACIYKGRRHQIRVHLAHAGYPLVGDPVYGSGSGNEFFLHHCLLDMPGFQAWTLPDQPSFAAAARPYLAAIVPELD